MTKKLLLLVLAAFMVVGTWIGPVAVMASDSGESEMEYQEGQGDNPAQMEEEGSMSDDEGQVEDPEGMKDEESGDSGKEM